VSYFENVMQVNLRVKDLNASIMWYQEKLGLSLVKKYGGHTAVLDFGILENNEMKTPSCICLIKLGADEEPTINNKNGTHPVLQLSHEYCETIYEEFKGKDIRVEDHPKHKAHFCFFDLDDNMLELYLPGIYN
jgi:catechol 2,3-dioxygenase-like lactoylglutathione lyase family enzyme